MEKPNIINADLPFNNVYSISFSPFLSFIPLLEFFSITNCSIKSFESIETFKPYHILTIPIEQHNRNGINIIINVNIVFNKDLKS